MPGISVSPKQDLYRRLAGYLSATRDRTLSAQARVLAGVKGATSLAAIALNLLILYVLVLIPFTPSVSDIRKASVDQPSLLISADGRQLAAYKRMNREWVLLNRVSPHVINALIATEDHRFYEHGGLDFRRIASAALSTVTGDTQGGSTLTQQLARNLLPEEIGRQRTPTRKIKEIITALKIEHAYAKEEILEIFLNTVPFLYNAFGIEMAARTYFDKHASRLNVLESATLIGMLKGTSYYNPVLNPERAVARRNVVLSQMVKQGHLTQSEFTRLKNRPLRLDFERQREIPGPAPHFAEFIRRWLVEWADRNDHDIHADGLRVHTTLDSRLQAMANQAVARQMEALQAVADVEWSRSGNRLLSTSTIDYLVSRPRVVPFAHFWTSRKDLVNAFVRESAAYRTAIESGIAPETALAQLKKDADFMARLRAEKTRLQTGFVAIDPRTGGVKAWVGSRDFQTDQYDHVTRAQRQPGSVFKPFVYGAALEQGMSPKRVFRDDAVEIPLPGGGVWKPTDQSAPTGRPMTVTEGLVYSKNTITAQIMQEVGASRAAEFARRLGVKQSRLEPVPALALGTSPVTPLEIVSAYSTLAALGEYRAPLFITHITDRNGKVLAEFSTEAKRALGRETAEELIRMMRGVVDKGTGQGVRAIFNVRADVAGKTGTTQNNTDGWFVLMHPGLVAGAWVGFNDPRVALRSDYWGQGARNALYVVADFFRLALNARLVDATIEFPGRDRSFVGEALERFEEWLGRRRLEDAAPASPQNGRDEGSDSGLDAVRGMMEQMRKWLRNLERLGENAS